MTAQATEAKKNSQDLQEAYFVNGQALAVYLKMLKIFLSS